ncbi:MAG TPA: serine--tRNA ligase [Acidobacteriota bacterium]|nr:serine--tRNA ligase [Acidobacteriota bacterium]
MLDRTFIRENLDRVAEKLSQRGYDFERETFRQLDDEEKEVRLEWEELRAKRNKTSDQIAQVKRSGGDASPQIEEMKQVGARIKELDGRLAELAQSMEDFLLTIPNLCHDSVPPGEDESANQEMRTFGEPRAFDFPIKDHVELGEDLGILDLQRAGKIAGARFAVYLGAGARLEHALARFMLDVHTKEHGYTEVLPPYINNRNAFVGTGQLPKFEQDLFKLEGHDFYLVPTAEVPVTNLLAQEILEEENLPISLTAYTPCFRSEAGSYGKDTRGLIRQHQFNKVELVKFARADDSYQQLEQLTSDAESILQRLELPYRVVTLCSGDTGFSSAKTYDLEVWIPSQNTYREISSCSNFEDFQARRASIRYRPSDAKKTRHVHTLNGSGLAVGRTWVALLENFQEADGTVLIPQALRPYMDGLERITVENGLKL